MCSKREALHTSDSEQTDRKQSTESVSDSTVPNFGRTLVTQQRQSSPNSETHYRIERAYNFGS